MPEISKSAKAVADLYVHGGVDIATIGDPGMIGEAVGRAGGLMNMQDGREVIKPGWRGIILLFANPDHLEQSLNFQEVFSKPIVGSIRFYIDMNDLLWRGFFHPEEMEDSHKRKLMKIEPNPAPMSDSKKVRLAILGCGGMAGEHARRFSRNPEVQIVSLCDVSGEEALKGFIQRNLQSYTPPPAIFTNAATMYSKVKPEAVVIVTPHTMHFEHGVEALNAGCHVFMEKPMVTQAAQAYELAACVRKTGKIMVIGYNTPCTREYRYLRELIRSKTLGKLHTVTGWQTQNWLQLTRGSWRQNPELSGGGQCYDSGAHMFNSLVWSVEREVSEVFAFVDHCGTPVDINGTVNIRFVDGTLATMTISGDSANDGAGMYYTFEDGRVEVDGWGGSWIHVFKKGEGKVKYPPITGTNQTPNDNFVDAILGRAEPMTSPANGIIQSELMDAIYESAKTGKVARPVRA